MKGSGKEDVVLVRHIFEEIDRIQKAYARGDFDRPKEDMFCGIAHPSGNGEIPIGRKGMEALDKLTISAIKASGLSNRIAAHTARRHLGKVLAEMRFEQKPVDLLAVQQAFGSAAKHMRADLQSRIHLVPCHLVDVADPDEIQLGPVTFLNRSALRKQLLQNSPKRDDALWTKSDRDMLAQAVRYYRGFQWVAAVKIEKCDPKLSDNYARHAATLALSALQLGLGTPSSQRMAIEGVPRGWSRQATLRFPIEGGIDVAITHEFKSGANFEAGWSEDLKTPGMQTFTHFCGIALEAALPGRKRRLSDRFLSALQWFGEAVREDAPATRMIKFMTAIEHVVLTEERAEITNLMASRVVALADIDRSTKSRMEIRGNFLRLYGLRSGLIHGRISPWAPEIVHDLGAAAELAENVMIGALRGWDVNGLTSEEVTLKQLQRWYAYLVEDCEMAGHVIMWRDHQEAQRQIATGN
ncbi:MAG: hypothetical protein COA80_06040 [Leeuwenhoekiella sp.]|nr:MAG: hypothetical protein COA80_06040 [Leeuwenhoekiella sp.]